MRERPAASVALDRAPYTLRRLVVRGRFFAGGATARLHGAASGGARGSCSGGREGAPLGLRGGFVGEREALLGSSAAGAFGRMAAGSAFAGIEGSAEVGAWRPGAGVEVGTVDTSVHGGRITVDALHWHAHTPRADSAIASIRCPSTQSDRGA